jgi:menaquinone-specific isochorismate synthase
MEAVNRALKEIEAGHFQKVVLARQTIFKLAYAPDPFEVAAALESRAKGSSLFCVQFNDKNAFLGASPERLFQRDNKAILFDAIAGTRPQGPGMDEELLSSDKDRREFQFVQDYLEKKLGPYCIQPITFSPLAIHKAANVQHLFSQGKGILSGAISDREILKQLHPTPAVCGTPNKEAGDWIYKEEPFCRNLYTGVVGWSNQTESDWTVAIRSCFLSGETACIYTGTGIVAGSDPAEEWDELEAKLGLYSEVFSCGN